MTLNQQMVCHKKQALFDPIDCGDNEAGRPRYAGADLIRQAGISEQTLYRWNKDYASRQSDQKHPGAIWLSALPRAAAP
ncbi:hypothetical protein FLK63_16080 [Burkholderia gladioli]|nr:hypothetical protein [Burkholderia gladioli]